MCAGEYRGIDAWCRCLTACRQRGRNDGATRITGVETGLTIVWGDQAESTKRMLSMRILLVRQADGSRPASRLSEMRVGVLALVELRYQRDNECPVPEVSQAMRPQGSSELSPEEAKTTEMMPFARALEG